MILRVAKNGEDRGSVWGGKRITTLPRRGLIKAAKLYFPYTLYRSISGKSTVFFRTKPKKSEIPHFQ